MSKYLVTGPRRVLDARFNAPAAITRFTISDDRGVDLPGKCPGVGGTGLTYMVYYCLQRAGLPHIDRIVNSGGVIAILS